MAVSNLDGIIVAFNAYMLTCVLKAAKKQIDSLLFHLKIFALPRLFIKKELKLELLNKWQNEWQDNTKRGRDAFG